VDETLVKNLAIAYSGYALIQVRDQLPLAPSWNEAMSRDRVEGNVQTEYRWPLSYRIGYMARAASYWAVIDSGRSRQCFSRVREFTYERRSEREVHGRSEEDEAESSEKAVSLLQTAPLRLLAGEHVAEVIGEIERGIFSIRTDPKPETMRIILTVAASASSEEKQIAGNWLEGFWRELRQFSSFPVGRLALPLKFYEQFARLVTDDAETMGERLLHSSLWRDLGDMLTDRIEMARASGAHWKQLQSKLLPLEPELLALFTSWMVRVSDEDLERLLEPVPRYLRAYLVAAARLAPRK